MLDKMKSIPEKVAFVIGLTLILISPIFLFLMSLLFPFGIWTSIFIEVMVCFFAIIFILSAADKRQSRIGNTK